MILLQNAYQDNSLKNVIGISKARFDNNKAEIYVFII